MGNSIISVARERETDLMLLGWPAHTPRQEEAFGSVIDLMAKNPPCDLAIVRLRRSGVPGSILVPIAGGPNARLAMELAVTQADAYERREGVRPEIVAVNLVLDDSSDEVIEQRRQDLVEEMGIGEWPIEVRMRRAR